MYAVIQCKWHQYIVTKGSKIVVDSMGTDDKEISNFDVLAVFEADWSHVSVGAPVLKGVTVVADNAGTAKGEKINVLKFKRKNRYERNIWFRPLQTTLLIKEIKLHA
jgi:large subunit ribosomal protein L21